MPKISSVGAGLVLLFLVPLAACAQAVPDSVHHRNDCRLAHQVLTTGQPAPKLSWSRDYIWTCADEGAIYLESAMRRLASSEDSSNVIPIYDRTAWFRDGRVVTVALEVAGSPTSSRLSRLLSLRTLWWSSHGGFAPISTAWLRSLADPARYGRCPVGSSFEDRGEPTVPVTQSQIAAIDSLGDRLVADSTVDQAIRSFAECIRR